MLNADVAPRFGKCPRCHDGGFQRFTTHAYCVGCNYYEAHDPDEFLAIPGWVFKALKEAKKKAASPVSYLDSEEARLEKSKSDARSEKKRSRGKLERNHEAS